VIPNTYLHSFWNESFAEYSTGLYARNVPIGNAAERRLAFIRHPTPSPAWNAAPVADGGVDIGPPADALGYGKGSYVLGALEDELGTERMEATLHHWVETHPRGASGEWEDYERAVQESTGQDFSWFFDQWLRRTGSPKLSVSEAGFDGNSVTLKATFDGLPYRVTAEVLLVYSDGSEEVKRVVIPPSSSSIVTVEAKSKPSLVSFDPYRRLIRDVDASEIPPTLAAAWGSFSHYAFGSRNSALNSGLDKPGAKTPDNLNGVVIIGMPGETPIIAQLAAKAGFELRRTSLTYEGTTIDLAHNAAMALIDLGAGRRCLLALGKPDLKPNTGDAWIALTDHLGRFLRGKTLPKTSGRFVFSL
jgi:hypothetical protein